VLEAIVKRARVLAAFVCSAALTVMALDGAAARAAGPVQVRLQLAPNAPAAARERKNLRYSLGMTIAAAADTNLGPATRDKRRSSAEWAPRVANWSSYQAGPFDLGRLVNARKPSVKVLDQRLFLSRFTLRRGGAQVVLTTAF
jgi:hypothetical protein